MRVCNINATEEMEYYDREFQFYSAFITFNRYSESLEVWRAAERSPGRSLKKSVRSLSILDSLALHRELDFYCFVAARTQPDLELKGRVCPQTEDKVWPPLGVSRGPHATEYLFLPLRKTRTDSLDERGPGLTQSKCKNYSRTKNNVVKLLKD